MIDSTLQPGFVRFIQHRLPKLDSGNYSLVVTHRLGTKAASQTFKSEVAFSVGGERFSITPTDVDSVYPPAGASGEYFNVLPHLVLRRPMLPWIRSPLADVVAPQGDEDVPTWLALLVIDQDDPQPTVAPGVVRDLISTSSIASYLDARPDGQPSDLEFDESADDPCLLLDLDYALFQRIAPSLTDLNWLASVRVVSGQRPSADPNAPAGGEYAVLMANRLPRLGKRTAVHLVSLEGMKDHLPADTAPVAAPAADGLGPKTVRLVSLHQWSFDTDPAEQSPLGSLETFPEVLNKLSIAAGLIAPVRADAPDAVDVQQAIDAGFIGLDHQLRDGGRTVSWYRGPLAPYAVPPTLAPQCPLHSSDAALAVDPATGMLNVSYAAAWQLGRLMALSDTNFSTRLFRWKHSCARDQVEADEHRVLNARLGVDTSLEATAKDGGTRAAAVHAALAAVADKAVAVIGNDAALPTLPPLPPARSQSAEPAGMPVEVGMWLDRLRHLHGIPFRYLVPQGNMLGTEAIRFFVLDPNWVAALLDGAFSIGDIATGNLATPSATALAAAASNATGAICGFLLRSRAVKHWPGLQASPCGANGADMTVLRYEKLAEDTLICLIDGIATEVNVHEPPESMHFGIHESHAPDNPFCKNLRDVGDGHMPQSDPPTVPVEWRATDRNGAILIDRLAGAMRGALSGQRITSAEFALLMVEGVGHVTFRTQPPPNPGPTPAPDPKPNSIPIPVHYGHGPAVIPDNPNAPIAVRHHGGPAVIPTPAEDAARAINDAIRGLTQHGNG